MSLGMANLNVYFDHVIMEYEISKLAGIFSFTLIVTDASLHLKMTRELVPPVEFVGLT